MRKPKGTFKKIFDWMLNYQKENNTRIIEWFIGDEDLIFTDLNTNEVKRIKIDEIIK